MNITSSLGINIPESLVVEERNLFDNSKPREERDFKEIYPDLDENAQLNVFVLPDDDEDDNEDDTGREYAVNDYGKRVVELKRPVFVKKQKNHDSRYNYIKLTKQLIDYGLQDPNKKHHNHKANDTYIRPFKLNNGETIQSKIYRKQNQVEYDMDEQDYCYLMDRNFKNPNNIIKLKPEIFEILITILENEWSKLEMQMNNNDLESNSNQLLSLNESSNNFKYGNDDGIINNSFTEQKCAVCNDSDCDNSNAIVFCDGCDIAVHQECYGIAFIPEGQWLCRKCMINQNNRKIECCFCPSKTGAFKQLDNSLWSHVICALWINELYFANPIYMEPIEGIDLIPKSRWKLVCYICKQKMGACVQCSNRNCFQAYHVTCAKRAGLFMQMTKGVQGAIANKLTLKTYCDKHGPSYWDQSEVLRGIQKTRRYFHDVKLLNEQNDQLTSKQKTANRLNNFKWKTENNTPIPPKKFSDILFQTLINLRVEDDLVDNPEGDERPKKKSLKDLGYKPKRSKETIWEELRVISNEICKYWCLKRELKNGAPLIRKNNNLISISSILYGINQDQEEINEKLAFSTVILKDIEKLINLTELNLNRQYYQNQLNEIDLLMIDTAYFPMKKLIEYSLVSINKKHDSQKSLLNYKFKSNPLNNILSLPSIFEKNENYGYESVSLFLDDITFFNNQIIKENKLNTNIMKTLNKWFKEFLNKSNELLTIEAKIIQEFSRKRTINAPHIKINGNDFSFKNHDPHSLLKSAELGVIDNDGNEILENDETIEIDKGGERHNIFTPEYEKQLFNRFLSGE